SVLGRRTAELHRAFAMPTDDPAFAPEPITKGDLGQWRRGARNQARAAFAALEQALPTFADEDRARAEALLAQRELCAQRIDELTDAPVHALKTRIHGDYHLGQVLVAQNDFYILDFEGEPARSLAERRAKSSPAKDVAGMLRSFDYAAWTAVMSLAEIDSGSVEPVREVAENWRRAAEEAFLDAYLESAAGCPSWPRDETGAERSLDPFLLERGPYEIWYAADNRPNWIRIPLQGVSNLLGLDAPADDQDYDQGRPRCGRGRGAGARGSRRPLRPARAAPGR